MTCKTCGFDYSPEDCRIVVIETDTGGTLVSRAVNEDETRFLNRYYSLVDSGRYPNMTEPQIECKSCRTIRYKEMEEEMEYWDRKLNRCY